MFAVRVAGIGALLELAALGAIPVSLAHHPKDVPHGLRPGRSEASIEQKETQGLAVMIESFRAPKVARQHVVVRAPQCGARSAFRRSCGRGFARVSSG